MVSALERNGIQAIQDQQRGFDHGLFVLLKIMYPDADIPCVQLSLVHSLDPDLYIQIGKALQSLEWDNLLVIGSGFSFHNVRAFFSPNSQESHESNIAFDEWLTAVVSDKTLTENIREERLVRWESVPSARFCHPREEHLIPLHVCYGMTTQPSEKTYKAEIIEKRSSKFYWRF